MSDNKPQAIAFFRMYDSLHPIFAPLWKQTDYVILTDFSLAHLSPPPGRVQEVKELFAPEQLTLLAQEELSKRGQGLMDYLRAHLCKLPYSESFNGQALETFEHGMLSGIKQMFYHIFLMEKLIELYDVRCVVTSPPYLIRHMAVIATAKAHQIPTAHIPHGSFGDMDFYLPESSDYYLLGDSLGKEIIETTRVSNTKCVITGSPFNVMPLEESDLNNPNRQTSARQALSLPLNAECVVYAMTGFDALLAVMDFSYYELVTCLQAVMNALKVRKDRGKEVVLILRQHPGIKPNEHDAAFEVIAAELGFEENVRIISSNKEQVLDAADVVIAPTQKSSVIFDAFARAVPTVALSLCPKLPHIFADTGLNNYLDVACSTKQLETILSGILDNAKHKLDKSMRGYEYLKEMRKCSGHQATANIVSFLKQVSEGKRDNFDMEYPAEEQNRSNLHHWM